MSFPKSVMWPRVDDAVEFFHRDRLMKGRVTRLFESAATVNLELVKVPMASISLPDGTMTHVEVQKLRDPRKGCDADE